MSECGGAFSATASSAWAVWHNRVFFLRIQLATKRSSKLLRTITATLMLLDRVDCTVFEMASTLRVKLILGTDRQTRLPKIEEHSMIHLSVETFTVNTRDLINSGLLSCLIPSRLLFCSKALKREGQ